MFQMLGETSIFTFPGKVPLSQKCQNDILCGNVNMAVSLCILKLNFFFKNTCATMTAWNYAGLLQSKSEMIYLLKRVCLIIIHTDTTHILDMPCCYHHHQQSYHSENTKIRMLIDILLPLKKVIPIMFERVTKHYKTL